jgi:hypothetical protein
MKTLLTYVPLAALIVATGVGSWHLYKHFFLDYKLKVEAQISHLTIKFIPKGGESTSWPEQSIPTGNPPFLHVKITNLGRNAITVQRVGGLKDDETFHINYCATNYEPASLPRRLEPGEVIDVAGDPALINWRLQKICVWDSTGKEWRLPGSKLLKLRDEVPV